MIKHNTKSSKDLVTVIQNEEDVIAMIPQKELFNRSTLDSTSLSDMIKEKSIYLRNKEFFNDIDSTFTRITNKL